MCIRDSIQSYLWRELTRATKTESLCLEIDTFNKLLSEVKTRMVLENGLVIHIWEWNEKAKELGLDRHPNAGLIAQDVEHMFPEAVIKDDSGYLMVDLPVLMDMDDLISKLVLEGGVARLVQAGTHS